MIVITNLGWGVIIFSALIILCGMLMWHSNKKMARLCETSIDYAIHQHFVYFITWVLFFNIFMLLLVLKNIYFVPERLW